MKKGCLAVVVLTLLITAVLIAGALLFGPTVLSRTIHDEPVMITINDGDSLHRVSERLKSNGVIHSALWFRHRGSQEGIEHDIKPGSFIVEPDSRIEDIFDQLQLSREQREHIRITFPEGFTLYQIGKRLEENTNITAEEFLEATNRYHESMDFDFDDEDLYYPLEGYLFPDTYEFEIDVTADQVVAIMAKTMEEKITPEWEERMAELGLTRHEFLTLASMVEKEAYGDDERDTIAGVLYNRLDINMLLQIDATVVYGLDEGRELTTRVLFRDLEVMHPFNTYQFSGIPPGPIANPGRNSLEAVLNPESHDYLYFVLGEEGGHVFTSDYNEHQRNVEAYRNRMSP